MKKRNESRIAEECWRAISDHFLNVESGAYVIMPNHVHGIIVIRKNIRMTTSSLNAGARHASPLHPHAVKPKSVGAIAGSFKSTVARRIGRKHNTTGLWQRIYYEHVIRHHEDWVRIHRYIESNPPRCAEDQENPIKS